VANLGFSAPEAGSNELRPPRFFFGGGRRTRLESKMLCSGMKCLNRLATEIAEVYCDRLLLANSSNSIIRCAR